NYGTSPAWSPYRGTAVQQAITFNQGNSFTNNTYLGTWNFMPIDTGHLVSFATWQAAPYNQDGGSTLNGSTPAATLSPAPTPVPTSTPVPTATPVATATPTPTPTPAATPAPTPTATPASGGSTSYLKTFETGTENLVNWFNTTVAQSTATAHSGTHSLAVTENSQFWGIEEALPSTEQVTAGTTYRVTGWGKSGAATEPVTLQVRWLDDADNSLDVSTISAASLTSSSWTSLSSTVTAPAGATTAQFMVSSNSGSTGSTVYFDDLAIAPVVTTVTPVPTPTPDTTAPSTPSGLSATTSSSPSVQLAWQASTDNVGVTSYLVRRGGVTIAQLGAGTLSYTDTNVVAGASYDYTVAAVDAAGNVSADSSALNVKLPAPPDTQAPSVPAGLAATPVSSSQINLSWAASTDNVGVVGYKVYRAGAEIANVTTLSYGDTNLTAGTSYSYAVAAYDAAGNVSGQSPIIAATTAPAPVSTGSICGNVRGWLGFALAGATVKTTVAGATVSAVTNSSGVYCLSNLPYGTYKLTFGAKNYYSKNVAATLNSSSLTVNVNLIRK
ncbi:MAG TPA: carboxypeptidase regulatory-like domain-containing protein, partial [Candidatus Saccharimonadia bacterium]